MIEVDHLYQTLYCKSIGDVTDGVMGAQKVDIYHDPNFVA